MKAKKAKKTYKKMKKKLSKGVGKPLRGIVSTKTKNYVILTMIAVIVAVGLINMNFVIQNPFDIFQPDIQTPTTIPTTSQPTTTPPTSPTTPTQNTWQPGVLEYAIFGTIAFCIVIIVITIKKFPVEGR